MAAAIVLALVLLALGGVILTSAVTLISARKVRSERARTGQRSPAFAPGAVPNVSILKPLAGALEGLEESLAAFASLEGVSYEVILSIADPDDPARDAVDRVRERFPSAPLKLVVGGGLHRSGVNPKVDRLVAAAGLARGRVVLVSDANVRMEAEDLLATLRMLEDPGVGCVSNLFVGSGARSLGSLVESLHLLTFVLPGNVLADAGGVPCVVGKSMALRREVLAGIGGFAAFADVLAEDQAIGLAVVRAGFRTALSAAVVENVTVGRTVREALARQARWNRIRWAFGKATYAGELLLNPFPIALLAWLAALALLPASSGLLALCAAGTALVRILTASLLNEATGRRLPVGTVLLMPLKDVLQLVTQAAPLLSSEVRWHHHRVRIGPGTRLLPPRRLAPAA